LRKFKEFLIAEISRVFLNVLNFFMKREFVLKDAEKTIGNLIDNSKTAFISSVDEEGFPSTKAMLSPRERNGIKTIYFSTNTSSVRVSQFRKNSKACVYFCDSRFFRGVMLKGLMEVLEDGESKRRIWRDGDTLYYKLGVDDPDYCVLRFSTLNGRYYSNFKSENFDV
jgi:general stress protein 26